MDITEIKKSARGMARCLVYLKRRNADPHIIWEIKAINRGRGDEEESSASPDGSGGTLYIPGLSRNVEN